MDSFDVKLDHERKLVRVTATGELFQEDGEKIITTARTVAAEHTYDVLYDVRESRTKIPMMNWFDLPRQLPVFGEYKMRRVQAAILISPEDSVENYKFYETVTSNLGLKLKVFFNEDDALAWLGRSTLTNTIE